ncbi:hypothetical protein BH11PLA1_BH11PLA1_23460 [soil metagenome]
MPVGRGTSDLESTLHVAALNLALLLGAAAAHADTVTIGAANSNTLYEDLSGGVSGGASPWFFAGEANNFSLRRGLLQFDLAAANLPAGATITGATLTLYLSRTSAGAAEVSIHQALGAWGSAGSLPPGEGGTGGAAEPGDATWLQRFYSLDSTANLWNSPGGDFAPDALATTVVASNGFYTWSGAALAADVQRWATDPSQNFGWVFLGDEGGPMTAKRFDSPLNSTLAHRPSLQITYSVPAPHVMAALGCLGVLGSRRRRPLGSTSSQKLIFTSAEHVESLLPHVSAGISDLNPAFKGGA